MFFENELLTIVAKSYYDCSISEEYYNHFDMENNYVFSNPTNYPQREYTNATIDQFIADALHYKKHVIKNESIIEPEVECY